MSAPTPRRATGRASSHQPGRVRRSIDGAVQSDHIYGDSLEVNKQGRLETRLAHNSGLQMTREGLKVDPVQLGDKNRDAMNAQADLTIAGVTAAEVAIALNALLQELRRTKRVRS
jgi:hypothetical protein